MKAQQYLFDPKTGEILTFEDPDKLDDMNFELARHPGWTHCQNIRVLIQHLKDWEDAVSGRDDNLQGLGDHDLEDLLPSGPD